MSNNQDVLQLRKDDVLCLEGDPGTDLYLIQSGTLLICISKGTEILPLARLGAGEFVGELSYFDNRPRSTHVICLETAVVVKIPLSAIPEFFPPWLLRIAKTMTARLRDADALVQEQGLKRIKAKDDTSTITLDMEEQSRYSKIIKEMITKRSSH